MKNTVKYDQVADYFIALSNETQSLITNLKLQKLTYYAQAWHLAIYDEPLIEDEFEAWVHGPVLPALYNRYKHFSWKPIIREDLVEGNFTQIEESFNIRTQAFLKELVDEYFEMNAYELEKLTHKEDPWKISRGDIPEDQPSTAVINKDLMKSYYAQFLEYGKVQS